MQQSLQGQVQTEDDQDGIRIISTSRPSSIGRVRTCSSLEAIEWTTIGISLLTILLGIGATIFRFVTLRWDDPDIIFSILILLNLCFASFYLFHGIFQEQPFEMVTLSLTVFLVWILIIVNYFSGLVMEVKLIRMVITSVLTIPNIVLALAVGRNYWESGNLIFKTVGGEIKFQRFCRQLFFAYSLLAFDVQAQVCCLVLALQRGLSHVTPEHIVMLTFGLIYTFVWARLGYVAMRTENLRLTWLFGISSLLQPVYVVFLFTQAIMAMDVIRFDKQYSVLSVAVYISATSLVLAHFTLLGMTVIVSHNYGKGLRAKVYGVTESRHRVMARPSRSTEEDVTQPLLSGSIQQNYDAIEPAPY